MLVRILPALALGIYLLGQVRADDTVKENAQSGRRPVEGFWQGFWGGGEANGVIRLPALAELLLDGNRVKMLHFPSVGNFTGTVRVDETAKTLRLTPDADREKQPMPETLVWSYAIEDEELTLTLGDNSRISLERCKVETTALANTRVELCAAKGIDEAGNLVVTRCTLLQGADPDSTYFSIHETKLKTGLATVLLVQKAGVKKISVSEARPLLGDDRPVALAYRHDDRPLPPLFFRGEMFKELGDVPVDNEAVFQTLAKTLRPGTLVFIVSSKENAPVP